MKRTENWVTITIYIIERAHHINKLLEECFSYKGEEKISSWRSSKGVINIHSLDDPYDTSEDYWYCNDMSIIFVNLWVDFTKINYLRCLNFREFKSSREFNFANATYFFADFTDLNFANFANGSTFSAFRGFHFREFREWVKFICISRTDYFSRKSVYSTSSSL